MDAVVTEPLTAREARALAKISGYFSSSAKTRADIRRQVGEALAGGDLVLANEYFLHPPEAVLFEEENKASPEVQRSAQLLADALSELRGVPVPVERVISLKKVKFDNRSVAIVRKRSGAAQECPHFEVSDLARRSEIRLREENGDFSAESSSGLAALGRLTGTLVRRLEGVRARRALRRERGLGSGS